MTETNLHTKTVADLLATGVLSGYEFSSQEGGTLSQRITNLYGVLKTRLKGKEVRVPGDHELTLEDVADAFAPLMSSAEFARLSTADQIDFDLGVKALREQYEWLSQPPVKLADLKVA